MTRESKKVGQVPILPHIGTYSLFIGYSQLLRQNELPSMREKLCGVAVLFKNRLSGPSKAANCKSSRKRNYRAEGDMMRVGTWAAHCRSTPWFEVGGLAMMVAIVKLKSIGQRIITKFPLITIHCISSRLVQNTSNPILLVV
jgi:hypothetical protein